MTSRARRVFLAACVVLALFATYETFTSFVAYTDDAYVRTDLIALAPEVTGRIIAVHVKDNEAVKKGDPLVSIDPAPFQFLAAQKQAEIEQAKAQARADHENLIVASDRYEAAASAAKFAAETQQRIQRLTVSGDVALQSLDRANDELRQANDTMSAANAAIAQMRAVETMRTASLARAEAEFEMAQWRLARTELASPADGIVNNLTVRSGDTATENTPLIGILDAHAWRVVANFKQSYVRDLTIGDTAWVWLDSQPWRWRRGHIAGIGQGISRDAAPSMLLPYVAPTTDWIRLQRRFPVTILLDDPDLRLFMGADARVLIFP